MLDRWNWTRAGLWAFSSVAVAALVWSVSGQHEKRRPRRRKRSLEDEDDASANSKEFRSSSLKGGRGSSSEDTGADVTSKSEIAKRQAVQASAASAGQLNGNSNWAWTQPKSPTSAFWPTGSSGAAPGRWQAAMSASEKKELDLMFRHQERHDGRTPHTVVDITKAKARQRNRQHRREVLSPTRSVCDVAAVAFVPEEDIDPELLAEELLAEEAAANGLLSPTRAKKAKKHRKKKPFKPEGGEAAPQSAALEPMDGEEAEEPMSSGGDMEASATEAAVADMPLSPEFPDSPEDVEAAEDGDDEEEEEVVEELADHEPPQLSLEIGTQEKLADIKVCDASVRTHILAGTPTTEDPSEAGAPSTRQGSEAGDDTVAQTASFSEAAAISAAIVTAGTSAGNVMAEAPHSQTGDRLLKPARGPGIRAKRSNRSWADLTDTSDCEPTGAWSIEPSAVPLVRTVFQPPVSAPVTSPVEAAVPVESCEGGLAGQVVVQPVPTKCLEEPSEDFYERQTSAESTALFHAQQHSWVMVQTRSRARKAAKF